MTLVPKMATEEWTTNIIKLSLHPNVIAKSKQYHNTCMYISIFQILISMCNSAVRKNDQSVNSRWESNSDTNSFLHMKSYPNILIQYVLWIYHPIEMYTKLTLIGTQSIESVC